MSEITENGSEKKYQYNDRGLEIQRDFIKSNGPLYKTITTKWHDTLPLPLEINNTGQRQSFQYDTNGRLIEYTNGFKDLSELNQGQDIALLQFNDFTDEAGNIWETVGNPQIVDDPDAVTGKALYLDGKSHLFTTIDKFQFGKGDFTIEFRFKVKPRVSSSDAYGFVGTKNAGTPDSSIGIYAMNSFPTGAMVYHAYQSHTPATGQVHGYPANLNILDNKWHHIAYVRKNNVLTVYYDGISRLTINDPTTYQFEPESTIFRLGNTLEGYLDQVRIAKKAIYTENFAPTNQRFELNNHVVENSKGKDVTLLQFNDFIDKAGTKWAKVGNPKIVDDPEAVTGKALYLDGESYLNTNVEKFQFGLDDFTIEFWEKVKPRTSSTKGYVFLDIRNMNSSDPSLRIITLNSNPVGILAYQAFKSGAGGEITAYPNNLNILDNKWHHVAYVRKDNIVTLYFDGIKQLTVKDSIDYQFYPEKTDIKLGSGVEGYLDQIRISKRAIYTTDFTPSREPYILNQGVTN